MENAKQTIQISDGANIHGLICAVINHTIHDFVYGSPIQQVDALEFLCSDDFPIWADAAGVDTADPAVLLQNPQAIRTAFRGSNNKRKR